MLGCERVLTEVPGGEEIGLACEIIRRPRDDHLTVGEHVGAVGHGRAPCARAARRAARRSRCRRRPCGAPGAGARRSPAPGRGSSRRPCSRRGVVARARASASICCSPAREQPGPAVEQWPARAGKYSSARSTPCRSAAGAPARRFSWHVRPKNSDAVLGHVGEPAAGHGLRATRRRRPDAPSTSTIAGERRAASPETVSSVVVLPAPLGPSRATTSPASTWRSTGRGRPATPS